MNMTSINRRIIMFRVQINGAGTYCLSYYLNFSSSYVILYVYTKEWHHINSANNWWQQNN